MADASSKSPLLQALASALAIETIITVLLVLPSPKQIKTPMLRFLANSTLLEAAIKPMLYFFALVALTCIVTTRQMINLQAEYHAEKKHGDIGQKLLHEAIMFRTERDFFISAGTALFALVVRQLFFQLRETGKLEASFAALKKQADGAVQGFKVQQDEIETLKRKLKEAKAIESKPANKAEEGVEGENDSQNSIERICVLEDDLLRYKALLKEAKTESESAEKREVALKRQAENLSTEYSRLLDEKKSLENKLADFELVMGADVKKNK